MALISFQVGLVLLPSVENQDSSVVPASASVWKGFTLSCCPLQFQSVLHSYTLQGRQFRRKGRNDCQKWLTISSVCVEGGGGGRGIERERGVCARARVLSVAVCVCAGVCMCARLCAQVRMCVPMCTYVLVYLFEREGG